MTLKQKKTKRKKGLFYKRLSEEFYATAPNMTTTTVPSKVLKLLTWSASL